VSWCNVMVLDPVVSDCGTLTCLSLLQVAPTRSTQAAPVRSSLYQEVVIRIRQNYGNFISRWLSGYDRITGTLSGGGNQDTTELRELYQEVVIRIRQNYGNFISRWLAG
jgi:hypothetical protein